MTVTASGFVGVVSGDVNSSSVPPGEVAPASEYRDGLSLSLVSWSSLVRGPDREARRWYPPLGALLGAEASDRDMRRRRGNSQRTEGTFLRVKSCDRAMGPRPQAIPEAIQVY